MKSADQIHKIYICIKIILNILLVAFIGDTYQSIKNGFSSA